MKLFVLEREDQNLQYDSARVFVIRAESEPLARLQAALRCGDEGERTWIHTELSRCYELSPDGDEGVICRDFQHG